MQTEHDNNILSSRVAQKQKQPSYNIKCISFLFQAWLCSHSLLLFIYSNLTSVLSAFVLMIRTYSCQTWTLFFEDKPLMTLIHLIMVIIYLLLSNITGYLLSQPCSLIKNFQKKLNRRLGWICLNWHSECYSNDHWKMWSLCFR